MPILLPVLIVVLVLLAWQRRTSTLRRECRWRLNRLDGERWHLCAACSARVQVSDGNAPRHCLAPEKPE